MTYFPFPTENAASVLDQDDDSLYPELLDEEAPEFTGPWCVSVFLVDRAYGGPEEGGWYYGCGEPVLEIEGLLPSFYADEDAAIAARKVMEGQIERLKLNEGRREISSVLSEGQYRAVISEGWPKAYPEQTPRYE